MDMNLGMNFGASKFIPSDLPNLKLWTQFNSGITTTGSGVSQWDDVSGNGNHLKQGTDVRRPPKQADGSILFDGAGDFLKADAFTLVQPETIYLLLKQVTWTSADRIFDGNTVNTGLVFQTGVTPSLTAFAGAAGASTTDLILDTYGVMSVVFDHDNNLNVLQIDNNTPATDTAFGTSDMGGFVIGAGGDDANTSNIQVKECLVYSAPHDASQRAQIINYLLSI